MILLFIILMVRNEWEYVKECFGTNLVSSDGKNVGQGDEVIGSSMTFISPVNTIKYMGVDPVCVTNENAEKGTNLSSSVDLYEEYMKSIFDILNEN